MAMVRQFRVANYSTQLYEFPGDAYIDDETYAESIDNGYLSSVATCSGAAASFGLLLDFESVERWKRIAACAGLVDDLLDDSENIQAAHATFKHFYPQLFYEGCIRGTALPIEADERLLPAAFLLKNSVKVIEPRRAEHLFELGHRIGSIALEKSQTSDIDQYIDLLREEAASTAGVISESVSDVVREQDGFHDFKTWCNQAIELAALADHAFDFRRDVIAGRTSCAKNLRNQSLLYKAASRCGYHHWKSKAHRQAMVSAIRTRLRGSSQQNLVASNYAYDTVE